MWDFYVKWKCKYDTPRTNHAQNLTVALRIAAQLLEDGDIEELEIEDTKNQKIVKIV